MHVSIVTVAYLLPDGLPWLLASARSRHHTLRFRVFRHSTVPAVIAACEAAERLYPVTSYPYGTNRGLARSWNEGILDAYADGADLVVLVNDDIEFGRDDLDRLIDCAVAHPAHPVVTPGD